MKNIVKRAWFNLILALVMAGVHGLAFLIIFTTGQLSRNLNTIGFAVVGVIFAAMAVIAFRKPKHGAEYDEREKVIGRKVLLVDYVFLWAAVAVGCVGSLQWLGLEGRVPVYILCCFLYVTFLAAVAVHSVATIVLYGGGTKEEPRMDTNEYE